MKRYLTWKELRKKFNPLGILIISLFGNGVYLLHSFASLPSDFSPRYIALGFGIEMIVMAIVGAMLLLWPLKESPATSVNCS